MFKRLTLFSFAMAAALATFAAPDAQLSAATCDGPGGQKCKENQACVDIIFYKHCTTTTDYWSEDEDELEDVQ